MKIAVLTISAIFAITANTSAQNTFADSSTFFFARAKEAKADRRFLVAYQDFQKALELNGTNPDYLREAALTAVELRKYDIAKIHFEKLNQQNKNDTLAIRQLAELNFSLRKWPQAIVFAEQMKQKQIGNRYNYILGKSHYEQENYGDSYKYLTAAAKDDPKNAEIPYLQARSFVDMSNYKMAVKYFDEAIILDSTKANWIYEAGLTYFAIPDARTAIKYFERAIRNGYKTSSDVLENLSNAYVEAGQPEKGIELMKKLLEKKPADMDLLWNIAEVHFKTNKYTEAIEYWDRILYYDKSSAKSLYMIGLSYQMKGEKEKGQLLCDKAIEMDPSLRNLKQKKEMPAGL